MSAGDDGRPDWKARVSCNYMTAGVEVGTTSILLHLHLLIFKECANKLIGECNTEEDVTALKDTQIESIIRLLEAQVEDWDSDKCPVVK